ncbi:hypothetical protein [Streptomyces ureilyticus]|uniref:Uncharacterized protein n=1 Tax=Streptomyces ureilyticus TaxID=1775131 RepID=A0ABX0E691_9ACTN|nr:hypothetical protein [Streptomyces ureilyticus]NGO48459.1 hypothetical protein [Streptomyces ureilyticus]
MTAIQSKTSRSSTISTTPKISPSTISKASKPSESSKTDTPEPGVRDDASFPQTQDVFVGVLTALRRAVATGDGSHSLTVMANTSNNRVVGKALGASVSAAFDDTAETTADTFD